MTNENENESFTGSQEDREKWIFKISALLRKAESTTSEHEADACFSKAQELMTKWAISEATLTAAGKGNSASVEIVKDFVEMPSSYFESNVQLIHEIARNNDVKCVVNDQHKYLRGTRGGTILVGTIDDINRVKMLYTALLMQVVRKARKVTILPKMIGGSPYTQRRSFRIGFAFEIGERLEMARAGVSGSKELLLSKNALIDEWMSENMSVRNRNSNISQSRAAIEEGRRAGKTADIGNARLKSTKALPSGRS